jgi:ELWxxDGT repeat protein
MFRQILLPVLTAVFVLAADVQAQQVQSLAIMHPDTENRATYSLNTGIQAVGSSVIFNGYDSEHGNELWVSSNGAAQAELLYDFTPGSISSSVSVLARRKESALLRVGAREVWITNATTSGTSLLATFSSVDKGASLGAHYIFPANDGARGVEPWLSDGTTLGTRMIADLTPGSGGTLGSFFSVGAGAVFVRSNAPNGNELWYSDGTSQGTQVVLSLPPTQRFDFRSASTVGEKVLFGVTNGPARTDLWITDGTTGGTRKLFDSSTNCVAEQAVAYCFATVNGDRRILETDGTALGTRLLELSSDVYVTEMVQFKSKIFGAMIFPQGSRGFGAIDPTSGEVEMIKDISDSASHLPRTLRKANENLYYLDQNDELGQELWVTDGTSPGTRLVQDSTVGSASSEFRDFIVLGSNLYVSTLTESSVEVFGIIDGCSGDASKFEPGVCGCGVADEDSDSDGSLNCVEQCPFDPAKDAPFQCGCGVPDADFSANGIVDCFDPSMSTVPAPPRVKVRKRRAVITMQAFPNVSYQLELKLRGKKARKVTSMKEVVTRKNLPPGKYTVRYRIRTGVGDAFLTSPSRAVKFKI